MADVQPENGTAPIAYAILEAMSHDSAMRLPAQIMLWVVRNTYGRRAPNHGPRRKACSFSWNKIAEELGADRSRVSRVGRWLISTKRLQLDARGHIGLQKDYEKWAPIKRGGALLPPSKAHGTDRHARPVQIGTRTSTDRHAYKERAREVLAVQSEPEGSLTRPAPPTASRPTATALLPNGKADTMRNRAELGHDKFPPDEHPGWDREDFRKRDEFQSDWDAAQRQRENDKRAAEARAAADKIARETAAYDAAEAAMTEDQKKERAEKHTAAMRELRERRWPK